MSTLQPKHCKVHIDFIDDYVSSIVHSVLSSDPRFTILSSGSAYDSDSSASSSSSAPPPPPSATFSYADYENVHWSSVLSNKLSTCNFCVRKGISRKAQLSLYTSRHVSKNPTSILSSAVPKTMIIETWAAFDQSITTMTLPNGQTIQLDSATMTLKEKLELCLGPLRELFEFNPNDDFILKPSATNKGAGIVVCNVFEQLEEVISDTPDIREWILQKYISRPLLLNKRKFHIRAYVLAMGAIKVYFYDEILALCSGSKYKENNTSDLFAHITNTAYQALDPNFREEECVLTMADVEKVLRRGKKGGKAECDKMMSDMREITKELFAAYKGESTVYQPLDGCFEYYGIDFLVDENFDVSLLEVNPSPDFKQTGERLEWLIGGLIEESIDMGIGSFDKYELENRKRNWKLIYESQANSSTVKRSMTLS
ncbi:hypothetical protein ScalyP_jg8076 [Parmales sp. scaly parma]|nr:hypothetical protein ScalyP_jg8076 [Parmales sp. scaly parma]